MDAELAQSAAKRAGIETENASRTVLAFDYPAGAFQHLLYMRSLDDFERGVASRYSRRFFRCSWRI